MIDWQYSESIESSDILSIKKKYTNFVGGKFVEPKSKKYRVEYNHPFLTWFKRIDIDYILDIILRSFFTLFIFILLNICNNFSLEFNSWGPPRARLVRGSILPRWPPLILFNIAD